MTHFTHAGLLELYAHFLTGIDKHKSDPSFPDITRICNVSAVHDQLAGALLDLSEAKVREKQAAGKAAAEVTQATVLARQLIATITAWAGKHSDRLADFGLKPHKRPPHRARKAEPTHKTGRTGHATSGAPAATSAPGGAGETGSSTPAPSSGK